jgi:hypothetical protein
MDTLLVRSKVQAAPVTEVEAAVKRVFAALQQEQPNGIRYTSCRLSDGVAYVTLLELDDGGDNPLPALPECASLPGESQELDGRATHCKRYHKSGSCALCVMSESSSGEDAHTTPPSSCRGSENGEGVSYSDEVINAHPAFQQP